MNNQAYLAGGCFWCLETIFSRLKGVNKVVSGYSGGTLINPTYEMVCSGKTGHAELIEVSYQPDLINYDLLFDVFFAIHDPTTLNSQGNDIGTQYRSAIFYQNDQIKQIALDKIYQLNQAKLFESPIVTSVEKLQVFYPAEKYHQNYYQLNPEQGYCQAVISPKLTKFRKSFTNLLKN